MKSRYLIISLWLSAAVALVPHGVLAAGEQVANLSITANLSKSDVLDVTERIDYDFGGVTPHAISYNIPLSYQDDQGNEFPIVFHLLSSGVSYSVNSAVAQLNFPAGSGRGVRHYLLHYTLTPVVVNGPANDVLKYNSTGLGWSVPVAHISFTLVAPAPAGSLTCFTGSGGTTSATCQSTQAGDTASVATIAALPANESLTVYCDFPSNTFSAYLQASGQGLGLLPIYFVGAAIITLVIVFAVWFARRQMPSVREKD